MEFNFDGVKYISNQIFVNVRPQIKIEEGVWLSLSEFVNEKYEIIEQIVENVGIKSIDDSGIINTTIDIPKKFNFVKLKENLGDDIGLQETNFITEKQFPENSKFIQYVITYAKRRYQVIFSNLFKGEYIFTEKDIINLPRKNKIEDKIILKQY